MADTGLHAASRTRVESLDIDHRRWPHRRTMRIMRCPLLLAGMFLSFGWGCAQALHSNFHRTDPTFTPAPGPRPRVYVESTLADVPRSAMRSVGIIEITVSKKKGIEYAVELAADKGSELGCWLVIEHSSFKTLQSQAPLPFGARVILTHSPILATGHSRTPATLKIEFDCVVQVPSRRAMTMI